MFLTSPPCALSAHLHVRSQIDGSSNHFRYDSGYWTSSSNTYRPNVFNGNYGENVKTYGFNYGRYREVRDNPSSIPVVPVSATEERPGGVHITLTPSQLIALALAGTTAGSPALERSS